MFNYSNTIDRALHNTRQMVPVWAGMEPGQYVLDLCCGTGAQTLIYSQYGLLATGLDNDPSMLSQNLNNMRPAKIEGFDLLRGDAQQLPFKDSSFDWASIQFGLHEKPFEARLAIIQQMIRVVKPDGHFVLLDFSTPLPHNFMGMAIRLIERMAGQGHYACFKDYHKRGGLLPLLKANEIGTVKSVLIIQKSVSLIKAANHKQPSGKL